MKFFWNKVLGWFSSKTLVWSVSWSDFWSTKSVRVYAIITVILNILAWVLAGIIKYNLQDRMVIFHYNILFGTDYVANSLAVFRLPIFALLIFANNFFLGLYMFSKKEKLLVQILLATALVLALLILVALYSIYSINYINISK